MSWFRDEEKERASLNKKMQYQEELKAQMRANEEALGEKNNYTHAHTIRLAPLVRILCAHSF